MSKLILDHQAVHYPNLIQFQLMQTFQPCHCQNLEDPKKFPKKPGDLAKNLEISEGEKLR